MAFYGTESPIYAEIDLAAFRNNLNEIKRVIGPDVDIMAVVKADAYGHGGWKISSEAVAGGVKILAVARMNEAVQLRMSGIKCPMLLFDDSIHEDTEKYLELDLRPTINSYHDAEKFSDRASLAGRNVKVHIKVDTGMGRLGFLADGLTLDQGYQPLAAEIRRISLLPFIEIEGIYSHFAGADMHDKSGAEKQLAYFLKLKNELVSYLPEGVKYHMANSAGIMEIKNSHLDLVRPGIVLYGLYPSDEVDRKSIRLKPVMSIKSRVIHIKRVGPGFKVSYGGTFVTERETVIATVPAGYADGISRKLSSNGYMLVRGKRAPIIGRVCMDLTMIDVTNIDGVSLNDEVVIIGNQGIESITADEIAERTGTINYEVVTSIAPRVPRIFLNGMTDD